ncbi:ATP synthase F1 subunit gamma [Spiroplasma endosymbiont of Danaus chrysippus]|uniref:ATP synthase F1 subunit gamma n=1 Tax=Spiroplasma endosymbiont of Danaus chrysippus TaxID=2691041 RepID=UPI0013C5847B|nr:ATP synthase F1 subunit gamma [Spiroplasma endosymbiont of Danaus chrysippus]CAB1054514.1 ATP synthase gamma chain (EC 3.6.3.14) [Spiroplasma endosymbiont of Danaus chrysippus]
MAQSMEQIRQKIKSVNASYKITKAMQLVSTAKLKKVGKRIEMIKPYYSEVYDTFNQLIPKLSNSIYLKTKDQVINKTIWVVFNSNLGLCGGFNNNLNKLVLEQYQPQDEIVVIGSKGVSYFTNHHCKIMQSYTEINIQSSYNDSQEISLLLLSKFNNKETDAIKIAYTKYVNTVTTIPTIIDLLPIVSIKTNQESNLIQTDFEPDANTIINSAIPLYVGAIVYGALVESQVSEQALRRLAMENASNNAKEMKDKLLVSYNRARQGAITQEISEIIGGADAQSS